MSNELEPGCLAIILKTTLGVNVGRIVTCVRLKGEHTLYGPIWTVYSKDLIVSEYGAMGNQGDVPAKWLKRVNPNDPVITNTKELEQA
jgi:hypothetical protein